MFSDYIDYRALFKTRSMAKTIFFFEKPIYLLFITIALSACHYSSNDTIEISREKMTKIQRYINSIKEAKRVYQQELTPSEQLLDCLVNPPSTENLDSILTHKIQVKELWSYDKIHSFLGEKNLRAHLKNEKEGFAIRLGYIDSSETECRVRVVFKEDNNTYIHVKKFHSNAKCIIDNGLVNDCFSLLEEKNDTIHSADAMELRQLVENTGLASFFNSPLKINRMRPPVSDYYFIEVASKSKTLQNANYYYDVNGNRFTGKQSPLKLVGSFMINLAENI